MSVRAAASQAEHAHGRQCPVARRRVWLMAGLCRPACRTRNPRRLGSPRNAHRGPVRPDRAEPAGHARPLRTDIEYSGHAEGAAQIETLLGVPARLLRDREGWATETFTNLGTHNATHVDAPWHYNSLIGGEPAPTIDELPLEWFFGPGVVLDMTARADGEVVEAGGAPARAGRRPAMSWLPAHIVLVRTGRDEFYGDPGYMALGPGVTRRGHPLALRAGRAGDGDRRLGLGRAAPPPGPGGHRARTSPASSGRPTSRDLGYSQIERLVNLGELPSTGFQVACFPLKIVGGSAAPARVVAIVPDSRQTVRTAHTLGARCPCSLRCRPT